MNKCEALRKFKEKPVDDSIGFTTTATFMQLPPTLDAHVPSRDTAWSIAGVAVRLSAVLGVAMAVLTLFGRSDFVLDDAYIHLSYAKSLRVGDGLSYNPGDLETGFSSPLWVLLLAAWPIPTGPSAEPLWMVGLLGALLHGATAMAGSALTLELLRLQATTSRPVPLLSLTALGGALVAVTPTLLPASTSGMEVPLAAATVLACAWAVVAQRPTAAALFGAAAVGARPEALAFVVAFCGLLLLDARRRRARMPKGALHAAAGAIFALAAWVVYDLVVSGHLWPNTHYVKNAGPTPSGLTYLTTEVLPWQSWLVSLTGLLLLGRAMASELRSTKSEVAAPRSAVVSALLLAMVLTWLGTVATRPLHPGVQFYESRYFAVVAGIPSVLLPLGLLGLSRWWGLGCVLPVGVFSGLQSAQLHEALAAHAEDTRVVHTEVARYLEQHLPPQSIVAVEGAGAIRYRTPRTMTIVDLVGLNDRVAAHLHRDRVGKLCHFVGLQPTHMVLPASWVPLFAPVFVLRPLARFDDPEYTQVHPPHPHAVVVFAVGGIHGSWATRCAARS